MKNVLLFVSLLVGLINTANAQKVDVPDAISASVNEWIIVVPKEIDGGTPKWRFDTSALEEIDLSILFGPEIAKQSKGKVLKAKKNGVFVIDVWNAKGDIASDIDTCVVTVGTAPNPPEPPSPEPEPEPTPTVGEQFVLLHESSTSKPWFHPLKVKLRELFGDKLQILDDDLEDAKAWADFAGNTPRPIFFVIKDDVIVQTILVNDKTKIEDLAKYAKLR